MKRSDLIRWCVIFFALATAFAYGYEVGYYRGYLAGATRVMDRFDQWAAELKSK